MSENVQGKSGPFSWLNENFEKIFMVTGLLAIILFITWQVIYRYIITQFIERAGAAVWTEELSRYIFIWISYLALSVAIKKRSSIRVDIIYDKLPERLQNISWIIVESLFLVLTGVITYFGWGQIERLLTFPQHTTALRIPFLVPYLILPLGFGLMCLRLLQRIWGQMRVCGALDSLLGFALALGILSPWYLVDYIDPLPVLFGYFALLCVIGVPIAISLGLSTLATIICSQTLPIEYMAQVCFTSIDSFPIMAIPFFIAAGEYMGAGGLSKRLLNLADEIVGGLYGGIGHVLRGRLRLRPRHRGRHRCPDHPGHDRARLRQVLLRRSRGRRRLRGRHDPAQQPLRGLRRLLPGLHRRPVHGRYRPRHPDRYRAHALLLLLLQKARLAR